METLANSNNMSVGKVMSELTRAAHIYFQSQFKEYNIGYAQVRTLFFIANNKNTTPKAISEHFNLDKSSVTSQIQILEKNGYIKRKISSNDARKQEILITNKTTNILPHLRNVLLSWSDIILNGLSKDEKTALDNLLLKMQVNARNKITTIQLNRNK